MAIDFGKTAHDYSTYRQGFPPAFFERLAQRGLIGPGKRVLDVGTGTGTLARGAACAGSQATGIDIAAKLMQQARLLDEEAGVQVIYHMARAEATGLTSASFDCVMAGQCWHWFDRPRAAAEIWRLLTTGGKVVIAHLDWIPLPGNVVAATEQLILKHNPRWSMGGGSGLYPVWLADLALAGFSDLETFSFDLFLAYSAEAWRGRIRASAGVAASLSPQAVTRFDQELSEILWRDFPQEPLQIHHRVWAVIGTKP